MPRLKLSPLSEEMAAGAAVPLTLLLLLSSSLTSSASLLDGLFGSAVAPEPVSHLNVDDSTLTAGQEHACALIASSVNSRFGALTSCWGSNARGQLDNVPSDMLVQLSAGRFFTCGVTDAMALTCWGAVPAPIALVRLTGQQFVQVSAGEEHVCALRANGSVACFGDDSWRQLRDAPGAGMSFLQVSCGGDACCALAKDGALACWGGGPSLRELVQMPPCGSYAQVTVGLGGSACAITAEEHDLHCWGALLGPPAPTPTAGGASSSGAAGPPASSRVLLLEDDGAGAAAGGDSNASFPANKAEFAPAAASSASSGGGSVLDSDAGRCSPLSRPERRNRLLRRRGPFTQVTAGSAFVCALRADGTPDCFGDTRGLWGGPGDPPHRVAVTDARTGAVVMRRGRTAGPPPGAVVLEVSSHLNTLCAVYAFAPAPEAGPDAQPEAAMDCWGGGGLLAPPHGLRPAVL